MVKIGSPLFFCALGCFFGRYFLFWLMYPGVLFLFIALISCFSLFSSFYLVKLVNSSNMENIEWYRLLFVFFIAGVLTGFSAFNMQNRKFTLPENFLNVKTSFTFEVKSDLKPYGDSFYSCQGDLKKITLAGITQTKEGNVSVLIPRELIKTEGHRYREVIACGAILSGSGSFFINKNQLFFLKADKIREKNWKNSFWKYRGIMRFRLMEKIESRGNSGGLLYALLTSSKEFLPKKYSEYFTKSGCAHVLALSGMHLSIICSLASLLWKKVMGKKWAFLFGVFAAICFYIFAGGSPSLKRAIIMVFISGVVRWAGVKIPLISVLSISFVFHTWAFPEESQSVSFLLSYGGLLGIILFAEPVRWFLEPYLPPWLCGPFSASVAAVLMTTGISAMFFGEFYLAGIIASIPVCILILLFLYVGGITLILDSVLFLPDFCFFPMDCLSKIIEETAGFFSFFPSVKVTEGTGVFFSFGVCLILGFGIKLLRAYMGRRSLTVEGFDKL